MYPRPATLREYDLFFFDCETGGLNPFEADMVEVACIRTDPTGTKVLDVYEAKVIPKKPVHPRAAEVNGYTAEKWAAAGAVELDLPMQKMVQMARNAIFTAHNAAFDWMFFENALQTRLMRWPSDYHRYCTVTLAMPLLRHGIVPNVKLSTLMKHFGIDPGVAHEALSDVRSCQQVFVKLMEIYDAAIVPLLPAPVPAAS